MKLKLEALRDVSILQVAGPVTPENFAILKAGIKKLFSTGKNKIILELPDSGTFPTPVLRDLAVLNLLASELSGQIILASIAPLTRAKIEAFSKPPVVMCFSDRTKAMEFFYPKQPDEVPNKAPAPAPAAVAAPVAKATPAPAPSPTSGTLTPSVSTPSPSSGSLTPSAPASSSPEDQQKYKKDIRSKEMGDLGETRKRLSELEAENKELKSRLAELMIVRRDPPDLESWKEKTAKLEKDLADAIKMAQDAIAAKK